MDCNVDTNEINEYYMLTDTLWKSIVPDTEGMLCIGCVETRLGRTLTRADFPRYPVNEGFFHQSERLKDRLNRKTQS